MLNALDPSTLKGKRDRAIVALLIGCGLRRAELLRLEVDQLGVTSRNGVLCTLALCVRSEFEGN
jgi:site-specific recombinase XerD